MLVVNPSALTEDLAEWIRDEAMRIHLDREIPISDAYREFIREELGLNLTVLRSTRGWLGGLLHADSSLQEQVQAELNGRFRSALDEIEAAVELLKENRGNREIAAARIGSVVPELKQLTRDYVTRSLVRAFSGVVFGVNYGNVACALVLRHLDPGVDLFLDGETFNSVYTSADWAHICEAFKLFVPCVPDDDPRQMGLFDSEGDLTIQKLGTECFGVIARIQRLDPACVVGRRWSELLEIAG